MEKETQKKQMETIYNIAWDVVRNWWVILCIGISAALLCYIASAITYHPTYTSKRNKYRCVCKRKSDKEAYGYISVGTGQSDSEEKGGRISGYGAFSGYDQDCGCAGDESSDGICDQ